MMTREEARKILRGKTLQVTRDVYVYRTQDERQFLVERAIPQDQQCLDAY